jgi:predicted N-acetyltransferase YhbS
MNPIRYALNASLTTEAVVRVFNNAGITRPTHDTARIAQMFANANLVVSAWDGDHLVGVARALSDFCYCCYLSDLAVDAAYQRQGIGSALITQVRDAMGDGVSLILLSAPGAMGYYPKVGFTAADNAFVIKRQA